MDHTRTPLFSALRQHAANNPVQFHIPGHKKGVGSDPEFREFIGDNALSIDLINIAPLDDLHHLRELLKKLNILLLMPLEPIIPFFRYKEQAAPS